MSNIFCSNCGTKHSVGAKFCSSCGTPLSVVARARKLTDSMPRNSIETRYEDDGGTDSFVRPSRLEYNIERGPSNKFKAEDIFKSNPIPENEKSQSKVSNYKKPSKEELLKESLRECAPRGIQDIDET